MTESSEENFKELDALICKRNEERSGGICSKLMKTKSARLGSMLFLIGIYFLAEVIVGHMTHSLTLVADSFHMLSDALSLIVALVAVRMSKRKASEAITPWPSKQQYFNTFGWVRFEVVGALINATFLLALCISILMEAIVKFYEPHVVSQPELVLAVGGGGLFINIIGLVLFGSHAHAGHDHDHGSHDHSHTNKGAGDAGSTDTVLTKRNDSCQKQLNGDAEIGKTDIKNRDTGSEEQMNMRAVFLHVLGDALGSVIVMTSATIVLLVPHNRSFMKETCGLNSSSNATDELKHNHWILYMDPVMSVILVLIMVSTTVPLFKKSSLILLQTVPKNIKLDLIKTKLENIEGVEEIHEFHIWQLAGDKYVATVHVQCRDSQTYLRLAEVMKERLHDEDIHSLTIQPEFKKSPTRHCSMLCASDVCKLKVCCEITPEPKRKLKGALAPGSGQSTDHVTTKEETGSKVKFNISPNASAVTVQEADERSSQVNERA